MKKCNKQETYLKVASACRPKVARRDTEGEFERRLARMRLEIEALRSSYLDEFADELCVIGRNYFKFDESDYDRIDKAVENELLELKQDLKRIRISKRFIDAILKDKAKKLKKREFGRRAFYREALSKR